MSTNANVYCYLCLKPTTEDTFCAGCEHYICDECDNEAPWGSHDAEDHKDLDPEEDE